MSYTSCHNHRYIELPPFTLQLGSQQCSVAIKQKRLCKCIVKAGYCIVKNLQHMAWFLKYSFFYIIFNLCSWLFTMIHLEWESFNQMYIFHINIAAKIHLHRCPLVSLRNASWKNPCWLFLDNCTVLLLLCLSKKRTWL